MRTFLAENLPTITKEVTYTYMEKEKLGTKEVCNCHCHNCTDRVCYFSCNCGSCRTKQL